MLGEEGKGIVTAIHHPVQGLVLIVLRGGCARFSKLFQQFFQPKQGFVAIFIVFVAPKGLPLIAAFDFDAGKRYFSRCQN